MMKIAWAYWKYWSAFLCSTSLVFVLLSHMSSQFFVNLLITTLVTLNVNISYYIRISKRGNGSALIHPMEGRSIYMYYLITKFNMQLLHNCSSNLVYSILSGCTIVMATESGGSIFVGTLKIRALRFGFTIEKDGMPQICKWQSLFSILQ